MNKHQSYLYDSFLKNYYEFLDPVSKWNYRVKSVRPLALVAIFAKRLMKMSGTLPLQMAIRDSNS